ncbi:tail fiber protein [Paenibacillus campinasensis]|uniref:Phage tail fibre protein N-terminal domain-containing protein n=1 Tax=Paenibacillus campinasensis TaxID=66347 RepID=A0A268ELD2_9BACL|nr:tail fiber protein [Paenibacillus campinasensis]PAD73921.1 hypothetical protein CHH67_18985 [Paenibacillus campinasensis]
MSSFGAKGLTNKGRVLQAKAQAGTQLKYTKYVLGDAQLGGQSIATLNGVISPKKTVEVTRLKMTPPNQATVGFVLSNQDVTTGFYFRELGLYALDPDEGEILYWYANAGDTADYIPPTNTGDVISKTVDMLVYVGTASNVTLTIDQNLAYVTHDELAAALEGLDPDIPEASLTHPGVVQLSNATYGTRENVAATEKAVKAAYDRGSAGVTAAATAQTRADSAFTEATAAKQLGVEQKTNVVAALNSIGVTASTNDTWAQLVAKMAGVIRATGNATAADLLSGRTASNASGPFTGTMPNRGAVSQTITTQNGSYTVPAGYHNGSGVIRAAFSNLTAGNIRSGVNVGGVVGTLQSIVPNTGKFNIGESGGSQAGTYDTLMYTIPEGVNMYTMSTRDDWYCTLQNYYMRFQIILKDSNNVELQALDVNPNIQTVNVHYSLSPLMIYYPTRNIMISATADQSSRISNRDTFPANFNLAGPVRIIMRIINEGYSGAYNYSRCNKNFYHV